MDLIEALEWLAGKRSMTNIIPQDPLETWQVRICQADAAMTEQAYLVVKAHNESLLNADKSAIVRVQELEAQLAAAQERNLVLARGILSVQNLINESRGVDGYMNDDIAEWDALLDDGCMLDEYSKALHLIHKTTTDSLRKLSAPPEQEAGHADN